MDEEVRGLDAYLAARRRLPQAVGAAGRARDPVAVAGLPPLERQMASSAALARAYQTSERDYLLHRLALTAQPALAAVPNAAAGNRLYQAVANLRVAGRWPWG